jgi:hypothetical protein
MLMETLPSFMQTVVATRWHESTSCSPVAVGPAAALIIGTTGKGYEEEESRLKERTQASRPLD